MIMRAASAGLDPQRYQQCLGASDTDALDADRKLGIELEVRGTPMFFLGRLSAAEQLQVSQVIPGAQRLDAFVAAIDRLLRE